MPHIAHAPAHGCLGENAKPYKGGEFIPFYKPRPLMPQVDDKAYPAMRQWFNHCGVAVSAVEPVDAWSLAAHQRIDAMKAAAIPPLVMAIPLLVSRDSFILDGNHRWLAHVMAGKQCDVIRVGLDFDPAIEALFKFLAETPQATLANELSLPI